MTNREYIKQKAKEYYSRRIDEANDEDLWIDILYSIEEDENIGYRKVPGYEFLFDCSTCEQTFGSCRNSIRSYIEDKYSENKCSERFYQYLNLERDSK